jgi:hypothetical protein
MLGHENTLVPLIRGSERRFDWLSAAESHPGDNLSRQRVRLNYWLPGLEDVEELHASRVGLPQSTGRKRSHRQKLAGNVTDAKDNRLAARDGDAIARRMMPIRPISPSGRNRSTRLLAIAKAKGRLGSVAEHR